MDSPPNILFVLADQLSARWLPLHGHPLVSTPRLQRFASQSTVFERALARWHERVALKPIDQRALPIH